MWSIYTVEYYSAIKRKEIPPFATTWKDLEGIMLSEISQVEKDKYKCFHSFVESKNQEKQKEQNSSRLTDMEKGTSGYQSEGVGKVGREGEGD